jgi:hypothetical protein
MKLRFPAVLLLALCMGACARPWMRDESGRIEDSMRFEVYSAATPGSQGIVLGPEAPPLALVAEQAPEIYGIPSVGYGYGRGRFHGRPSGGAGPGSRGPTILR